MKRAIVGLVAALALSMFGGIAAASGPYPSGQVGLDISWPNCAVPLPESDFGIIGVTGGTVYSRNPCMVGEAKAFGEHLSLYVNTGWNEHSRFRNWHSPRECARRDNICLAYNYGFNSTIRAFNYATSNGVTSDMWWLDVETLNTWSRDIEQNKASIQGAYDALKGKNVPTVGVYSTGYQWAVITGGWRNGWPNWVATGLAGPEQARKFCTGNRFSGGPTWMVQYIPPRLNLDHDLAC